MSNKEKIDSLEIDEEIKQKKLLYFVKYTDDESNNDSSNLSEIESENDIFEIASTFSKEEDSISEKEECASKCKMKKDYYNSILHMNGLNVLNKNESMILDLIDQIQDPTKKREGL